MILPCKTSTMCTQRGCRGGVGLAGRKWSSGDGVPDTCKAAGHIPAPGMSKMHETNPVCVWACERSQLPVSHAWDLTSLLSVFGLQLVSNNGPRFISGEFEKENGVKRACSALFHPLTNGLAGRFVQYSLNKPLRWMRGEEYQVNSAWHNVEFFFNIMQTLA